MFKIEKDIPAPARHGNTKYPFADMLVGDSFLADCENARKAAYAYGVKHNVKFVSKAEGNGLRIWRVE